MRDGLIHKPSNHVIVELSFILRVRRRATMCASRITLHMWCT
ncbi:hypothetical protein HMPREF9622_02324 [Cutibacterium modestum HL037PA3]|uniref:Uncharacterized protein n=1 Tax=Cutibacterium modestum HL044PA1 TaxID=765109 RepID=A0ABP2KCN2_9ACTN|nr:hypothetical protein HMPREF9621_01839 [Cutibacterium modestum HL037PA2]EFS93401.1 hypothetical protein HMPREF9607_00321 [Cutibacterium modestum HL044PA1]EFT14643.1 hypothetical protein HMPREF9622_02324 [Cutibacterium modestum HL037PA3]EGG25995.1 hypothetical protein PA08_1952 [Cutibacterium modestum P08]